MTGQSTQETLVFYDDVIAELDSSRDVDTDQIPVFSYSDELIDFMRSNDVVDPNDAYDLLITLQEETVAGQAG